MRYQLNPTQPYSLALSLKRLQDLPKQVVAFIEAGSAGPTYVRALSQGERLGLVRVWQEPGALVAEIDGELDPQPVLAGLHKALPEEIRPPAAGRGANTSVSDLL